MKSEAKIQLDVSSTNRKLQAEGLHHHHLLLEGAH